MQKPQHLVVREPINESANEAIGFYHQAVSKVRYLTRYVKFKGSKQWQVTTLSLHLIHSVLQGLRRRIQTAGVDRLPTSP